MAKTAWPTGAEVASLISTIPDGTAPTDDECQGIVDGVVAEFEARTGRIPFLAAGSASDLVFDPPDGRSGTLRIGIQATSVESVTIGLVAGSGGSVLSEGLDYLLEDPNAPALGEPYRAVRFLVSPGSCPQSVVIRAVWGWGADIPLDAWNAVRRKSAAVAMTQTMSLSGPACTIRQGVVERQYGIRGERTGIEDLTEDFEAAVARYALVAAS